MQPPNHCPTTTFSMSLMTNYHVGLLRLLQLQQKDFIAFVPYFEQEPVFWLDGLPIPDAEIVNVKMEVTSIPNFEPKAINRGNKRIKYSDDFGSSLMLYKKMVCSSIIELKTALHIPAFLVILTEPWMRSHQVVNLTNILRS